MKGNTASNIALAQNMPRGGRPTRDRRAKKREDKPKCQQRTRSRLRL